MKLHKLEALRGFAAAYVVLHHSLPHQLIISGLNVGTLFRFGQEAVILFFLLSGFVINYAFQTGSDKTFRTYFLKRFSRIFIPLLLIMLLGYVIESVRAGNMADPEFKNLGLNLLMLQDIGALKPNTIVEPYLHNTPLWSLSYEWWFYMLFFPVVTYLRSEKWQSTLIFGLAIVSAFAYTLHPDFVTRLFMYVGIWWTGVYLSNRYIAGSSMGFGSAKKPILSLLAICGILFVQAYIFFSSGKSASIGVHPFLELRHMTFAFAVLVLALAWNKARWIGFNAIFRPFILLAPMSYVIYISHHYLITDAKYLEFLKNSYFEWVGYFLCLLAFSYILEVLIYPKLQRTFLNMTMASTRIKPSPKK